jgi:mono/diheme cytochrome c family protein
VSQVRRWRWLLTGALVLLSAACYPGAYPLDIFPELHYQQSQRRLEPNRLAPPPGAVPVTGGRPEYTWDQARTLQNPTTRNAQAMERAQIVFRVNCSMCHGQDGHGQGPMAQYFVNARQEPPVDFTTQRARSRADGELYWLITNGIGNMPSFASILTEDERWSLVHVIREVQGQ